MNTGFNISMKMYNISAQMHVTSEMCPAYDILHNEQLMAKKDMIVPFLHVTIIHSTLLYLDNQILQLHREHRKRFS